MRRTYTFVLILTCVISTTVSAQKPDANLTLQEAVSRTLAHNPQLYQYTFIREALTARRSVSDLRPALELGLEVENVAGSGENKGFDSAESTLALSSVIELGNKRAARVSAMDARLELAKWQQQAATLDVLGELTARYVGALATQYQLGLAKEAQELSRTLLDTVRRRAERGAAPEAEVMRARAALVEAEIRAMALRKQLERQQVLLSRFWGTTHPAVATLDGDLFAFGTEEQFSALYAKAENSPALQVFASEARLKDAEVKLARSSSRSDLSWRVGFQRFEDTGDSAITAGVSMPLFSERRSSGTVRAALAERNAVDYARQDALLSLHARLFEAYSLREQNREAVQQMGRIAIPALEKALTLTREAYESGRYRYQDWLAAQEELLDAKQRQIEAATNVLLNQAIIEQLTGQALTR